MSNSAVQLIIGNMNLIDRDDVLLRDLKYVRPTYTSLLSEGMVLANQSAFWRRSAHQELGLLSESLDCAFDYDWFLRLLADGRSTEHVNALWGALRVHGDTKTSNRQHVFDQEFEQILRGREPSTFDKRYHQFRRLCLMLAQGELSYVMRGLVARLHR